LPAPTATRDIRLIVEEVIAVRHRVLHNACRIAQVIKERARLLVGDAKRQ
jgi:hypothetical protein